MSSIAVYNRHQAAAVLAQLGDSGDGSGGGNNGGGGTGSGPSGVLMPTTPPAGWVRWWANDFNVDCTRTQFLSTYYGAGGFNAANAAAGFGLMNAYPRTYFDTRSKSVSGTVDGYYGRYDPANLSAGGGVMRIHIWWDPSDTAGNSTLPATPNGKLSCAAPIPLLSSNGWGYLASMRMSVRARVVIRTTRATTKIAWLNWPLNNHSTTQATAGIPSSSSPTGFLGGDGECDGPEQDGGNAAQWFVHNMNGVSGATGSAKQRSGTSLVDFFDGGWHTYTTERIVGSYNVSTGTWVGQFWRALYDDAQVGSIVTTAVPMTPMRLVLQCESTLSSGTALRNDVDYDIEIDWLTIDVPG